MNGISHIAEMRSRRRPAGALGGGSENRATGRPLRPEMRTRCRRPMKAPAAPKRRGFWPNDPSPNARSAPSEARIAYYGFRYCAPSKAWRLLRGGSPRRKCPEGESPEGQELAARFVSSLAGVKEGGKPKGTNERHNRSVDRESHRPQGGGTSPKQSSLVSMTSGGRHSSIGGSQQQGCAKGKCPVTPPGSKSVACGKRDARNLGDPQFSRAAKELRAGRDSQLDGGRPMGLWESDHCIVLRDGSAVHMGKAVAGMRSPQRKHGPEGMSGTAMPTSLRGIANRAEGAWLPTAWCQASISEEPGAGKPHAGICGGAPGQPGVLPRYDPVTGRWPNRDPLYEQTFDLGMSESNNDRWHDLKISKRDFDGLNLYGFSRNRPVDSWDILGLFVPRLIMCCKCRYSAPSVISARCRPGSHKLDFIKGDCGSKRHPHSINANLFCVLANFMGCGVVVHRECDITGRAWMLRKAYVVTFCKP